MLDIATIAPLNVPAPTKPAREKRISKRLRQAIDLLVTGECKTQKAAAVRVGMHPDSLCRGLRSDRIRVFVAQQMRENISTAGLRASRRIAELIDADSEHVSLDASKHVLAIEGIKPPESGTNISIINNVAPGYVIKLRHVEETATVEHERVMIDAGQQDQ